MVKKYVVFAVPVLVIVLLTFMYPAYRTEGEEHSKKAVRDIKASPVEPNVVKELSYGIGQKSCRGCHLVHIPAAFAQERWEHWKEHKEEK